MGQYKANSSNSQNFSLSFGKQKIGELIYSQWYSFNAEIMLTNGMEYHLEPKGFWDSKIELKDGTKILLEFKMGWKGIIIKSFLEHDEQNYLLRLKGLLGNKFILMDTQKNELLAAETDFKWSKLNYDYTIETTPTFENFKDKELLLLTLLHCINYYMTNIVLG